MIKTWFFLFDTFRDYILFSSTNAKPEGSKRKKLSSQFRLMAWKLSCKVKNQFLAGKSGHGMKTISSLCSILFTGMFSWISNAKIVIAEFNCRIFYVSHDSQDLHVFSYVTREGIGNIFKCNVFKCSKKVRNFDYLNVC